MLKIFCVFSFVFLISCHGNKNTSKPFRKVWEIKLAGNLGTIEIELPKQFDTMFSWTQYSDCSDYCAFSDYRIQPKNLPVNMESGFVAQYKPDTVDQFTISLSKIISKQTKDDTLLLTEEMNEVKREQKEINVTKNFTFNYIQIDGHRFSVYHWDMIWQKKICARDLAVETALKGNIIRLYFEYRKSYETISEKEFVRNCLKSIETIKLLE